MRRSRADEDEPAPQPVTLQRLDNAAQFYLARFSSSAANLRRVLQRRLRRWSDPDPAASAKLIETLIERYVAAHLLDDQRYALAKSAGLHRRGASAQRIAAALTAKGIEPALIRDAITVEGPEAPRRGGDRAAAVALARRRRLGPFRPAAERLRFRDRDLASLARAGFSNRLSAEVLDCADAEQAMALIDQES